MIVLVHENNRPLKVLDASLNEVEFSLLPSITESLFSLAIAFPDIIIVWCNKVYVEFINTSEIQNIFHQKQIMASFSVAKTDYIPKEIGFIDQSVFINVKRNVSYPTWMMSSDVGGVSAEFLNAINKVKKYKNFYYFINSLAKLAMPKGLFCYSEPKLFKKLPERTIKFRQASNAELFKFAKQHYKWFWVFMLLFCNIIYCKRFPFFAFISSFFYRKQSLDFQNLKVLSSKVIVYEKEIDVIIPTIGRMQYLYDVLKDLAVQTQLPKNVIIVEQNPAEESVSELNFLVEEDWPFKIKHVFTHQTGACKARNTALKLVESEWVFLFDDDLRFNRNLISIVFKKIEKFGINSLMVNCLQKGENLPDFYNYIHQSGIFGSGNSIIKTSCLKSISFNMTLEFGYGEDFDFGVQMRNHGTDIIFFPDIKITHLKAKTGGFRTKVKHPWEDEVVLPKPSPTIMYTYIKHYTKEQIFGYKLTLFLKLLKDQHFKRYISFFKTFNKQWLASKFWAKKLAENNDEIINA